MQWGTLGHGQIRLHGINPKVPPPFYHEIDFHSVGLTNSELNSQRDKNIELSILTIELIAIAR